MSRKLYRVELTGSEYGLGNFYVIAMDPGEAYMKVKEDLEKRDRGLKEHRELECVSLIAEDSHYPLCKTRLYL